MSYLHATDQGRKEILKPIMPTGETEIDNKRFVNLQERIQVVDMLLSDVIDVFTYGYGTTPVVLWGTWRASTTYSGRCWSDEDAATNPRQDFGKRNT